jgi:cell division protein FtsB
MTDSQTHETAETNNGGVSSSGNQEDTGKDEHGPTYNPDFSSSIKNITYLLIGGFLTVFLSFVGGTLVGSKPDSLLTYNVIVGGISAIILALLVFGYIFYRLNKGKVQAAGRWFATEFLEKTADQLGDNVEKFHKSIDRLDGGIDGLDEEFGGRVQHLSEKVQDLKKEIQRLDDDIVKEFTGDTEGKRRNRGILNRMSVLMDRLSIADEEMYFYQEDPDNTEHHFIHDDQALTQRYDKVRILGTMMGVTGDGYNVCEHIGKLVEKRLKEDSQGCPFRVCDIAVPVGSEVVTSYRGLCARRFALQLLSTVHDAYEKESDGGLPNIEVRISFLSHLSDIFPAIQIWDRKKCLVVPSVGKIDHTDADAESDPVAEALPVAIGIRETIERIKDDKEAEYKLGGTLGRIVDIFEDGYFENHALAYRFTTDDDSSGVEQYRFEAPGQSYTTANIKDDIGAQCFDTSLFADITTKEEVNAVIRKLDDQLELQTSDSPMDGASGISETL